MQDVERQGWHPVALSKVGNVPMARFCLAYHVAFVALIAFVAIGCQPEPHEPTARADRTIPLDHQPAKPSDRLSDTPAPVPELDAHPDRIRLFDGATLAGWKKTRFGGDGVVAVVDGAIQLGMGYPLTGITSDHESLPTMDYEIQLQAQRIDGTDFFCGLTFPVGDSHCTLIVGGWGGTLVGLSSLDDQDAARNETARHISFDNGRWYTIRVRVESDRIQAWIDEQQVVDADTTGRKISLRNEVLLSRPLGICSFQTSAAIRNVEWWHWKKTSRPDPPVEDSATSSTGGIGGSRP